MIEHNEPLPFPNSEDVAMKTHKADEYPGFAPARRRGKRLLLTGIYLLMGLACFVLFAGPVLLAMAVIRGLADLSASIGIMIWAIVLLVFLPSLIELLVLLQTGQALQFVVRTRRGCLAANGWSTLENGILSRGPPRCDRRLGLQWRAFQFAEIAERCRFDRATGRIARQSR